MDIKMDVPKDKLRLEVKQPLNFPNREPEKKNLVNLSDEELAQLSTEELEEVKRAKENLLAIKKTTKEVDNMANQEKWAAAVQNFANEHGISAQEAENILKQRAGISTTTDFAALLAALRPEPSPIEQAISKVIAERAEKFASVLFPAPAGGGTAPQAALSEALGQARAAGAQSLYLPDGTLVNLGTVGNNQQDSILKSAREKIEKYVADTIDSRLPAVFNPQPQGTPLVDYSSNPEIAKLAFEDKWKDDDRKAQDAIALRRDGAIRDIAAMVGALLSPEGFAKVQKLLKQGLPGATSTEKKVGTETKPEPKMLKATCWKCMRVFPYEEGQDPVCPYCGQAQKVQCPNCDNVFIPTNRNSIVCPQCHAELQAKPEESVKQPPGEIKTPPADSGPSVSVGSGVLE